MALLRLAVFSAAVFQLTTASILRRDLTVPTNLPTGWSYVGCFFEVAGGRALSGAAYTDQAGMTGQTCITYCSNAGFTYAGTEYAYECYCGNTAPPTTATESECSMPCAGDAAQPCGAGNRLTVFTGPAHTPDPPKPIDGWTYVGCVAEGSAGRTLTYAPAVPGGAAAMTNELCTASCKSAGFKLAGTEYSGECYCGNSYANGGAPADDGCNMKCNGDQTEICGGANRLSVWSLNGSGAGGPSSTTTGAATSTVASTVGQPSSTGSAVNLPAGWTYKGCYIEPAAKAMPAAPGSPFAANTVESCVSACVAAGKTVAGMEYGVECYCDTALNNGPVLGPESDCNMACPGDASEKCGAGNRLSVYSKGDLTVWPVPVAKTDGLPGSWAYVGCIYDNATPHILPWLWEDSNSYPSSSMTIELCLARCSKFGYPAGGVEYGYQCMCGDVADVTNRGDVSRPESECNQACPGDRLHLCGSGNHINYYKWTGAALTQFSYASGTAAGQYQYFIDSPIIPLISTVGINEKVIFVEKHGTSQDDTEGSFEFDYSTNTFRELALKTDVFCSASFTLPDKAGRQINIGGWSADSVYGIRFFTPDSPQGTNNGTNVWEEDFTKLKLFDPRWYPSAMVLSNGSLLAMGGETGSDAPMTPSCEILPRPPGVTSSLYLDYLAYPDTIGRTNSYPFLAILPSGGIFFSQYNESRIISQADFKTVKMLPQIPGAVNNPLTGRNYPLQGTMMLMPQRAPYTEPLTVLICGGTTAEPGNLALDNCVSIQPDAGSPQWTVERMPSVRVVSCMVALPDGRYLILNGAKQGRAGFGLAEFPNLNAVLYDPSKPVGARMTVLANTTIARLYHSEAVLLSDGRVLVSGSDPQDGGKNPQEHRLEYFNPDYILSGAPKPTFTITNKDWAYGQTVSFTLTSTFTGAVRVSLIASVGSTHGNSMGQRTIFPAFTCNGNACTLTAPPNANVCPPSWYQVFVLNGPMPSHAVWVRIGGDPAQLGNWPQLPGFTTPGV